MSSGVERSRYNACSKLARPSSTSHRPNKAPAFPGPRSRRRRARAGVAPTSTSAARPRRREPPCGRERNRKRGGRGFARHQQCHRRLRANGLGHRIDDRVDGCSGSPSSRRASPVPPKRPTRAKRPFSCVSEAPSRSFGDGDGRRKKPPQVERAITPAQRPRQSQGFHSQPSTPRATQVSLHGRLRLPAR